MPSNKLTLAYAVIKDAILTKLPTNYKLSFLAISIL